MNNEHKKILDFLSNRESGCTSIEIAKDFLKMKNPLEKIANIAVNAIVGKIPECYKDKDGLWFTKEIIQSDENEKLLELSWTSIYLIESTSDNRPLCSIISYPFSKEQKTDVIWLVNPNSLSEDEQGALLSQHDMPFISIEESVIKISSLINNKIVVFFSYRQQQTLSALFYKQRESLTDDTLLISQLTKALKLKMSLNIEIIYQTLFNDNPILTSASRYGDAFTEITEKIINLLTTSGISTRGELINLEINNSVLAKWKNMKKSIEEITTLPRVPGVYGFKDANDNFLYIGKAKNLRRRLSTYFRITDESPAKLDKLRNESFDITIHTCGSELESLLYEQRLIEKYSPPYNIKIEHNERKGEYTKLNDLIILLPHTDNNKTMSFWYREDQMVRIFPFDSNQDIENTKNELERFFFSKKLPINSSNFSELEIFTRWVKKNKNNSILITPDKYSNSSQIVETLNCEHNNLKREKDIQ